MEVLCLILIVIAAVIWNNIEPKKNKDKDNDRI